MTKEEIIEIVIQIGGCDKPKNDSPALKMFETFAKLVAEHESKRLTDVAMKAAEKAVDVAIALEREECAKICEYYEDYAKGDTNYHATLIRARGKE